MEKLLSIVIPAYNVEQYLDQCIASLILPSKIRKRVEIIIVNDGSVDSTAEIAEKWRTYYPDCVRIIHKENGGHGSAINAGIRNASGKYFRVVDGDDWVDTENFLSFVKKLEHLNYDLVVTRFAIINNERVRSLPKKQRPELPGLRYMKCYLFRDICCKAYIRMHEMTIRTKILTEHYIHITEHSFYVDMEYILYPISYIQTLCVLPECVYQYRTGNIAQSVSIQNMQKNRKQHEAIFEKLLLFYRNEEEKGTEKEIQYYLAGAIARMQANQIKLLLSYPASEQQKKEIQKLDMRIKKEYPQIYKRMNKKSVWLLRFSKYKLYPLAAVVLRHVR